MYVLFCCFVVTISLGQLITLAGLDKSGLPFSSKPPRASDEYINGQSRLDTTQQMRTILENSRLDESVLSVDLRPAYNGQRAGSSVKLSADPTQQYSYDKPLVSRNGLPGSKFDELYQQALRNTESILSDSGNPPAGHITLENLHSPVRSADYELSANDSQLDASGLRPLSTRLDSAKGIQNGEASDTHKTTDEQPPDTVRSQQSHHSDRRGPSTAGTSQDGNKSADSGRVYETEISEEYTTEEDDVEEIRLNSQ